VSGVSIVCLSEYSLKLTSNTLWCIFSRIWSVVFYFVSENFLKQYHNSGYFSERDKLSSDFFYTLLCWMYGMHLPYLSLCTHTHTHRCAHALLHTHVHKNLDYSKRRTNDFLKNVNRSEASLLPICDPLISFIYLLYPCGATTRYRAKAASVWGS
jgi:hypothetical protein